MVESVVVTLLPALFLVVLFGGGGLLRRKNIDMDGAPPIHKALFYSSKYAIMAMWAAMVLHAWGVRLSFSEVPKLLKWISLFLWVLGFILLFIGRLGLGDSFRIGSPKEATRLKTGGLFQFSRNPMYLGVYATLLASALYILNPLLFLVGASVIVVHHRIILAEEEHLRKTFGEEYVEYCRQVRRYL